jgi:DNA-binding transcriptional MerR regulator
MADSHSDDFEGVDVPDKLFFRIGEAAELVGVETHVLRYWESEFKMRPQRSDSGQRMFRRKDIARFLRIRRLLHDEGFTIAGARKALNTKPGDAPSVATVETVGIRAVVDRIEGLRKRIAENRARFAKALTADDS